MNMPQGDDGQDRDMHYYETIRLEWNAKLRKFEFRPTGAGERLARDLGAVTMKRFTGGVEVAALRTLKGLLVSVQDLRTGVQVIEGTR